jgi:hypothetical protein
MLKKYYGNYNELPKGLPLPSIACFGMVFRVYNSIEKILKMKLYQLIALTGFLSLSLVSCVDNANREDNNLNNNSPALDTVNIKADTSENNPLVHPDSTIRSTDTLAENIAH